MGVLEGRMSGDSKNSLKLRAIEDIYLMFQESNKVIIAMRNKTNSMSASRIKNIDNLMDELLSPFLEQQKYSWGGQIFNKFKNTFSKNFQEVWTANRQQFYELLLMNCGVFMDKVRKKSLQDYFYEVAIHKLQQTIPNGYGENIGLQENNLNFINHSILMNENNQNDMDVPLFLPQPQPQPQNKVHVQVEMTQFLKEVETQQSTSKSEYMKQRVQNCSLLLPETVFVDRLSHNSETQVSDLLKYYNQFVNTANQLFYSNNLISCPLKHFVFTIQQKILRKKIKQSTTIPLQSDNISSNEQVRKLRKTRELNNNILLYEVKSFLEAYTTFVWMYLQLHLMEDTKLGKIINSEILYGIIFKSVWGFVDWIVDRGFQFEQSKLEEYYRSEPIKNEANLSEQMITHFSKIVQYLRDERHPQQYLKKVVIFYRQVSQKCENADQLLLIYEEILARSIKQHGGKQLFLFRMRNVIQKLLKIDQNSMSGGEISYSWTTWCILIELLREKINFRYGNLVISKGAPNSNNAKQAASFAAEESIVKNYS